MRILPNANLGPVVQEFLIGAGHDTLRVAELVDTSTPDPEIALLALRESRHLVTNDRGFVEQMREAGVEFTQALVVIPVIRPSNQAYVTALDHLLRREPTWHPGMLYIVRPPDIRIREL